MTLTRLPVAVLWIAFAFAAAAHAQGAPIIDAHFHTDTGKFLKRGMIGGELVELKPITRAEMIAESLAVMRAHNIVRAVTSGPDPAVVREWRAADPERIIPALQIANARLDRAYLGGIRKLIEDGDIAVLGEIGLQYEGFDVAHPAYGAYFALGAELDVPVAIHLGPGPYDVFGVRPQYRVRHGDPLLLEEVLARHPKLRLYVMHAAWPFLDNMIAIMHTYKNVYVDTAFLNSALPREEFHYVLRRLVGSGLGKRVMFGTDPHPGAITRVVEIAIERLESADFLTEAQKRDIFFNNAARFFRLDFD